MTNFYFRFPNGIYCNNVTICSAKQTTTAIYHRILAHKPYMNLFLWSTNFCWTSWERVIEPLKLNELLIVLNKLSVFEKWTCTCTESTDYFVFMFVVFARFVSRKNAEQTNMYTRETFACTNGKLRNNKKETVP